MDISFDGWEFLAGLGIFLLAMALMENSLEALAGRSFKKFLRQYTNHPVKAVLSGIFITIILQSSSVVSLMVLAFVGAGIIELRNAIGIIIGSNLGTTLTGWIVAYFGFSFNIESFTFPFIAIGGLSMVFFAQENRLYLFGQLFIGVGFLFLGLDYMKASISELANTFDISPFAVYDPHWLFLVGFVLTAVIQSSSAAMVITLSALNAEILSIEAAAAMVIGSDLGTTITVVLGGIKGVPAKKRVALSHFLFNFIVDVLALIFLFPLLRFLTEILGLVDPLFTLVAFHSSFNLAGIFLFFPFLGIFARFLEKRFEKKNKVVGRFITQVPVEVPEAALKALKEEVEHLLERVFRLNTTILGVDSGFLDKTTDDTPLPDAKIQYELIKELEGEITAFFIKLPNQKLQPEESAQVRQLTQSIRYAMSTAKSLKDINHNFLAFSKSVNDDLLQLVNILVDNQQEWYATLYHLFKTNYQQIHFEGLADLKVKSKQNYNVFLEKVYYQVPFNRLTDVEISTLFNINREIHAANKAMILAIKDLVLQEVQAQDFDDLPDAL